MLQSHFFTIFILTDMDAAKIFSRGERQLSFSRGAIQEAYV
jgi:hypothetical protein